MLKVLIADDETKVCKLIKCLIDWPSLGLEAVGVVHDGLSALEFIKEQQPDILITDIRMPGVDGLELIRQAKEWNDSIHFIIISGYNHFEYAQKAIKFGVEDYISKPIKKKELLLSLRRIIQKKQDLEVTESERNTFIQRIHTDTEKVRTLFLEKLVESSDDIKEMCGREAIRNTYYCEFTEEYFQCVIIHPVFYREKPDEQMLRFFTEKVKALILSTFSYFHEILVYSKNETVYCLFNGSAEAITRLQEERRILRNSIQAMQDVFTRMKVYLCASHVHNRFEDLPLCLLEAREASYDKLVTYRSIIDYEKSRSVYQPSDFITQQFRKEFSRAVETLDLNALGREFETLTRRLHTSGVNGKVILDVYQELLHLFQFVIKNYNLEIEYRPVVQHLSVEFNSYVNLNDLMSAMLDCFSSVLQDYQNEKKQEISKPIRRAKLYIQKHYGEPLTLEKIGNEVGLNPAYLSSIFKKETGASFVDYLNDIRIENAKQLLLEDQNSLAFICEAVGFHDMKYFTRRFKKTTGLSPTEYRKLYS